MENMTDKMTVPARHIFHINDEEYKKCIKNKHIRFKCLVAQLMLIHCGVTGRPYELHLLIGIVAVVATRYV